MKRLRNYWTKTWGWILSSLLMILGFTSCDDDSNNLEMYGCPTAVFSIKGVVENTQGQGLNGVRVIIPLYAASDTLEGVVVKREYGDTLYTDNWGRFAWRYACFPEDKEFELRFDDIHPRPGVPPCKPDTLKVTFLRGDLEKDKNAGTWDEGHAEKEITVILKEKKDEK